MEIVHATWARGGVFAFFSGNEAGVLRSLTTCDCPSVQQPVLVGPSLRWSQFWHSGIELVHCGPRLVSSSWR